MSSLSIRSRRRGASCLLLVLAACAPDAGKVVGPGSAVADSTRLSPSGPSANTLPGYTITPPVDTVAVGDSVQITMAGPGIGSTTATYWHSSSTAIATVGKWTGWVVGVAAGKVTISATAQITGYPSLTATVVVTTSVPTPPPPTPGPTWGIATQPQLPQATVNTSVPAPTGKQILVNAGDDLQAALNAAQPGDEVLL